MTGSSPARRVGTSAVILKNVAQVIYGKGPKVANTPVVGLRIPRELADAARAGVGRPDADLSTLVRAGLAVLAGSPVADALAAARGRRGPKPLGGNAA
jgi:hypothetical protein